MSGSPLLKIGEVADRVGLSLRTIRFYEEEGLLVPETRTSGGFRLYGVGAVTRLELIKRMKPLGLSVEEIGEVLAALDAVDDPTTTAAERTVVTATLDSYRERVDTQAADLLGKAARGRAFGEHLREVVEHQREVR